MQVHSSLHSKFQRPVLENIVFQGLGGFLLAWSWACYSKQTIHVCLLVMNTEIHPDRKGIPTPGTNMDESYGCSDKGNKPMTRDKYCPMPCEMHGAVSSQKQEVEVCLAGTGRRGRSCLMGIDCA